MSSDHDLAPIVRSWLEDGATRLPDRVLDSVLDQIPQTQQRRHWWTARRNTFVRNTLKLAMATGAVALAVVLGLGVYFGSSQNVGAPPATPTPRVTTSPPPASETASTPRAAESPPPASETASMPSPAVSPRELPIGYIAAVTAGRYSLAEFPVEITFEIPPFEPPAEWVACAASSVEQGVCYSSDAAVENGPGAAVGFHIVDNVVVDPCSDQDTAELRDPPVGPSVDDLVTAISGLEGFEATAPVDITVSGYQGKEFTLTAPETECGVSWATADRTTGMAPGERNLLQVIDVDGTRVMIVGALNTGASDPESLAVLEHVMDSVQIAN